MMEISDEHKAYLSHKHQGGVNNQKGNAFEIIYATKEVIRLFALGIDLSRTTIALQLKDRFIDDLLVSYPDGLSVFHQCKDNKNLCWNQALLFDFQWQKHYSHANGEHYRLKLVYSNSSCAVHDQQIPASICDVTDKELFPAYSSLNSLVCEDKSIQENIGNILFVSGETPELDECENFAEIIRSKLLELASPNRDVSLMEIKKEAVEVNGVNFKDLPNVELTDDIIKIFDRFPKFTYKVNGHKLYWSYSNISGNFNLSKEWFIRVAEWNPTDIFDLIKLLE